MNDRADWQVSLSHSFYKWKQEMQTHFFFFLKLCLLCVLPPPQRVTNKTLYLILWNNITTYALKIPNEFTNQYIFLILLAGFVKTRGFVHTFIFLNEAILKSYISQTLDIKAHKNVSGEFLYLICVCVHALALTAQTWQPWWWRPRPGRAGPAGPPSGPAAAPGSAGRTPAGPTPRCNTGTRSVT